MREGCVGPVVRAPSKLAAPEAEGFGGSAPRRSRHEPPSTITTGVMAQALAPVIAYDGQAPVFEEGVEHAQREAPGPVALQVEAIRTFGARWPGGTPVSPQIASNAARHHAGRLEGLVEKRWLVIEAS